MKNKNLYFIISIVAFSALGSDLLLNKLKLPFYLIELFFIPILILNFKEYTRCLQKIFKKNALIIFIMSILFLNAILMGIVNTNDIIGPITMSRSLIYIFIICLYFSNKEIVTIDKLFLIVLGSIIGEYIFILFVQPDLSIMSINLISLALLILIPLVREKIFMSIICIILSFFIGYFTGMRINLIIILVAALLGLIWNAFNYFKKTRSRISIIKFIILMIAIIFVLITFILKYNEVTFWIAKTFNMDPYAIYRMNDRMKSLLNLDFQSSQDMGRILGYSRIFNDFIPSIIPRGFIGDSTGIGRYIDIPILQLYDVFGSITSLIIVFYIAKKGFNSFINAFRKDVNKIEIVSGLMFPIYIILFMLNGRFLFITYESILSGIIFGIWFNKKIKNRKE